MFKFFNNKKAFTMAEVLLAVAVIGIVSALAIPNIKNSSNQKELVAKANKSKMMLDTAVLALVNDYGSLENYLREKSATSSNANASKALVTGLAAHLKYTLNCQISSSNTNCFTTNTVTKGSNNFEPKYPNTSTAIGSKTPGNNANCASAIINDGTNIAVCADYTSFSGCTANDCPIAAVWIDVNGKNEGSSKLSEDIFFGYIDNDGFKEAEDSFTNIAN